MDPLRTPNESNTIVEIMHSFTNTIDNLRIKSISAANSNNIAEVVTLLATSTSGSYGKLYFDSECTFNSLYASSRQELYAYHGVHTDVGDWAMNSAADPLELHNGKTYTSAGQMSLLAKPMAS